MARLLLIDDDTQLGNVFAHILGEAGHDVIQAASGPAGIEAARRARPDLVLCDVTMPGMDGYAVLAALRADSRFASTPFLFLTGLPAEYHARAAISMGADDYLTKPVSDEDLVKAVEARLARLDATRRDADRRIDEIQRNLAFLLPHELRTPLTVILGGSELLRDLCDELAPKEVAEMATAINKAGQRLNRMVENYLLHVGLELKRLGTAGLDALAFSGRCGGDHVGNSARDRAREHGRDQDLDLTLAGVDLPLAPLYAGKIVSELVDNALKFSDAGKRVLVALGAVRGRVALEVVDHGRGLTADEIAQVGAFRQFNRLVLEQQGSGLGLTLVRAIAEASGGTLELSSTPGQGTIARASWPH
ncbi:MAG TPA: response regulator [Vicinamibacteria bacterium]|jgi:two-component system sensor histidine kinase/response regulator|nr:response regulator [Vicinamibacteria bacterium]